MCVSDSLGVSSCCSTVSQLTQHVRSTVMPSIRDTYTFAAHAVPSGGYDEPRYTTEHASDTRRHNQHSEFVCASCEECRALVCLAPALATLLWRLQWLHMRLREPDGARISSRAHELLQLCEHLRRDRVALFHRGQSPTFIRVGRSWAREAVVEDLPNEDTDQ